jgi:hypothetical protein
MDLKNSLGSQGWIRNRSLIQVENCMPNYIDFHSVENMIHTKIAPMRTIRNF